jgi:hypothetical protein
VSPQRLVNYRNTWYLDAWCHAAKACDASHSTHPGGPPLESKALNVAIKELEAELDAGYGIYSGGDAKLKWAYACSRPTAAQWGAVEEWHAQQQGHCSTMAATNCACPTRPDRARDGHPAPRRQRVVSGDKALAASIAGGCAAPRRVTRMMPAARIEEQDA